jgi:hypothetical protein
MKSELTKLQSLKFDDEGEPNVDTAPDDSDEATPDHSITHRFFHIIVTNPGKSRAELMALAAGAGIKQGSSTSLLSQFHTRKLVKRVFSAQHNTDVYTATRKKYVPGVTPTATKRRLTQAQATAAPVHSHRPTATPRAQELLDTLPVSVARELYDGLKKLFGA